MVARQPTIPITRTKLHRPSVATDLMCRKQLQVLSLYGTHVSDVSGLQGLKELSRLDLRGTEVSDITPLREATRVKTIVDNDQDLRIPIELERHVRRY